MLVFCCIVWVLLEAAAIASVMMINFSLPGYEDESGFHHGTASTDCDPFAEESVRPAPIEPRLAAIVERRPGASHPPGHAIRRPDVGPRHKLT